jgi:glycerophosphoryl diester phosphodiesterase
MKSHAMKWGMLLTLICGIAQASGVIVIAHRGASGYLPEHTLEAKALAIGMGADYVEQDVVLTKDDVPIVTHDITLEDISDIAAHFPGRARADGHYYAIDFTIAELKTLRRHERDNADHSMVFPGRFPAATPGSAIVTLSEEIDFVQGINRSTGRNVGLYTEVKYPAWHRQQGKDITRIVLDSLRSHGYSKRSDKVFFQCFDADELKRVRTQLKSELKLIQLIGENSWHESSADYEAMMTERGIAEVASYADGIGPEITQLVEWPTAGGKVRIKPLGALAKAHGLLIHPYTLRIDSLPPNAPGGAAVLDALFKRVKVDGLFSDFPDVVVRYRNGHP